MGNCSKRASGRVLVIVPFCPPQFIIPLLRAFHSRIKNAGDRTDASFSRVTRKLTRWKTARKESRRGRGWGNPAARVIDFGITFVGRKHVLAWSPTDLVAQESNNDRATATVVTTLIFTPGYARISRAIDGFSVWPFGNWRPGGDGKFCFGLRTRREVVMTADGCVKDGLQCRNLGGLDVSKFSFDCRFTHLHKLT